MTNFNSCTRLFAYGSRSRITANALRPRYDVSGENLKHHSFLQERSDLTVRKLRCELGLQMAEFGTYLLGRQLRYRRGNASFTTMTAAIKAWGAYGEPPKNRILTPPPIIL